MPEWVSERDLLANGVRLFCLPHAGSGAAAFYRWKRLLPAGVSVCPVMLPGREIRIAEGALLRVSEIVDALHEAVKGSLDRPFAIFGHSMGALLAFEWAQRIAGDGLRGPACLFVSGRNAPHLPFRHRGLHKLADAEFVAELNVRYGGVPEGFLEDADMREFFLPILRADLEVVETYEYQVMEKLGVPVQAFAGVDDRSVSEDGLARWSEITNGPFSVRRFPGDHFYHLGVGQAELLRVIAETLG